MAASPAAKQMIERLRLAPHPEGGYYRELLPADRAIAPWPVPNAPDDQSIVYYLLDGRDILPFHAIPFEVTWHLAAGGPIEAHVVTKEGEYGFLPLAWDLGAGFSSSLTIPADADRALRLAPNAEWGLAISVRPKGRGFSSIENTSPDALIARCPGQQEVVRKLAREF